MGVIPAVVSQHAEELAFLWLLRDAASTAPDYTGDELAALDDRVDAQFDGLCIAGEAGWEICAQELEREEPGEVFAAGVLALESGDAGRIQQVLRVAMNERPLQRALISALGWIPLPKIQPVVLQLLGSPDPTETYLGLRGAAAHRWSVEDPALSLDPVVCSARLRGWAELGRYDRLNPCVAFLSTPDPELRFWAAWSSTLLGSRIGLPILREIALDGGARSERALQVVSRSLEGADALQWHAALAGSTITERSAIRAAGMYGDPALVPWLLKHLEHPLQRRVAGEALASICGFDLREPPLEGVAPDGFESGPSDDPTDDDVAMDPDDELPWPEADAIRAWWTREQGRFRPGTRHFLGEPISEHHLRRIVRNGTQRQRAAAALELKLRLPGEPLAEVRERGFGHLKR